MTAIIRVLVFNNILKTSILILSIHHYEVTQSSKQTVDGPADYSHKLEVNSDYPGAQSVSNREYEQREQDKKRQIRVLSPQYLKGI